MTKRTSARYSVPGNPLAGILRQTARSARRSTRNVGATAAGAEGMAGATGVAGTEGPAGQAGATGATGPSGPSAYDVAVANGFTGTEAEWLASLQGGATDVAGPAYTVSDWLQQPIAYVAHRGSGGEYPEMTATAFDASSAALAVNGYVPAIEISVNITADKTLVAIHDTTLDRTTTGTGPVVSQTWAAIANNVRTDESDFLGTGWEGERLATVRELLDRYIGKAVIFIEPKSNQAIQPLQALLATYPGANQSVVWKMPYDNPAHGTMRNLGYETWGYVQTPATTTDAQLALFDEKITMWGLPTDSSDVEIARFVDRGRPVMCWEVHRRFDVARLTSLGVKGLMTSQVSYAIRKTTSQFTLQSLTGDDFASRVKSPGNFGRVGMSRAHQPILTAAGEAYFPTPTQRSYMLASMAKVPASPSYLFKFSMMWPSLPSPSTFHSGVAFCKPDDRAYWFNEIGGPPVGGYHLVFRGNGEMQIYRHDPGVQAGVPLGTIVDTDQPVAGQVMDFEVKVTPSQISASRLDTATLYTTTSLNTTYRGPYFHLSTGSIVDAAQSPRFSNVSLVPFGAT